MSDEYSEEIDVSGKDLEETIEAAVESLLECRKCGEENEGSRELEMGHYRGNLAVRVVYTCDNCGAHNDNVAEWL